MPAEAEQPLETIRDIITVYGWTRVATPTNSLTRDRGEPGDGGDLRGASSREFAWQRSRQKFPSGISRSSHRHVQSEDADDGTPKTAASLADTAALLSCEVAPGELASCAALQQQAGLDDAFGIQRRATDDDDVLEALTRGSDRHEGSGTTGDASPSPLACRRSLRRHSSRRLEMHGFTSTIEPHPWTGIPEAQLRAGNMYDMAFLFGTRLLIDPAAVDVGKRLGEGSFSVVHRAALTLADGGTRDVAVKRIRSRVSQRSGEVAAFLAEAHVLAHLACPYVPKCIGLGSTTGKADAGIFVVQELLRGPSLASLLRAQARVPLRRLFSLRRAVRWMAQVAAALEHLHTLRPIMVLHRDVKSANIVLTSSRAEAADIKLVDFGLHKQVDFRLVSACVINSTLQHASLEALIQERKGAADSTATAAAPSPDAAPPEQASRRGSRRVVPEERLRRSSWAAGFLRMSASATDSMALCCFTKMCGSLLFMAPEVFTGGVYDERVDVFSLAMVCYELAVRKPLIAALNLTSHPDMLHAAARFSRGWRPPLPAHVHPALATIIQNCWSQNPHERWPATKAAQELRQLRDDLEGHAHLGCCGGCFG